MKIKTSSILICLLLNLQTSCKKKATQASPTFQSQDSLTNGPSVPQGEWKGNEDKIDPALGKLKALD